VKHTGWGTRIDFLTIHEKKQIEQYRTA
jgi:hypothetical protein